MAAQLIPIQLEDGTEIYIESTEDVNVSPDEQSANLAPDDEEEQVRGGQKGLLGGGSRGMTMPGGGMPNGGENSGLSAKSAAAASQSFKAIEGTIRTYTNQTLNAFKDMAGGNVDKVTLEFGIRIAGEAGVPYVTKGTAESNLSIKVECSFDKD
ncbi:MAG: CU044_2847 family protein [Cyanobacteria bacterium P01_D01_bin.36]